MSNRNDDENEGGKYIDCGIGQVIEGNAYFGGWEAFRHKSVDELRADLDYANSVLADARRAFRFHRAVKPFLIIGLLCGAQVMLSGWSHTLLRGWSLTAVLIFVGAQIAAVMATMLWMNAQREPLLDGLLLVKLYRKRIAALLALHEAKRQAGK